MPEEGEKLDLEIRVYGSQGGSFVLYDDDGVSFDYEQGVYSLTELKVDPSGQSLRPSMRTKKEGYSSYLCHPEWIFMTE
jgi:alpha-D-xyloside xylohydrolase